MCKTKKNRGIIHRESHLEREGHKKGRGTNDPPSETSVGQAKNEGSYFANQKSTILVLKSAFGILLTKPIREFSVISVRSVRVGIFIYWTKRQSQNKD